MRSGDLTKWIENLTLTRGFKAGDKFKLLPFQRQFIRGAFKRGVYRAALSCARGPGKTSLLAAIAAAAVRGPLAIAFELGRAVRRRFEVAGSKSYPHQTIDAGSSTSRTTRWEPSAESKPYPYQTIDAGWYIRTSLRYAP